MQRDHQPARGTITQPTPRPSATSPPAPGPCRVVASAGRLVRAEAKAPYLASTVRGEGAETAPGMVAPARQQDMERFGGMAEDLALELPHLQQGTKRGGTGGREEEPKRRKDGDEEELRLGRDIGEVFGVEGVTGKVERLLGGKLGEAVVQDRGQVLRVLFHASQVSPPHLQPSSTEPAPWLTLAQVWVGAASDRPLLAVWPLADLATLLPVGQQVKYPIENINATPQLNFCSQVAGGGKYPK